MVEEGKRTRMTYDRVCEKSSMRALIFFDRKFVSRMFQHVMIGMKAVRRATLKKWQNGNLSVEHNSSFEQICTEQYVALIFFHRKLISRMFQHVMIEMKAVRRTVLKKWQNGNLSVEHNTSSEQIYRAQYVACQMHSSSSNSVHTFIRIFDNSECLDPKSTKNILPKRPKWSPGGVKKLSKQSSGAQYVIIVAWPKIGCPFLGSFGAPKRVQKRIENHIKKKHSQRIQAEPQKVPNLALKSVTKSVPKR